MADQAATDEAVEVTDSEHVEESQDDTSQAKTFGADYVAKLRQEAARYRTEAKANADAAKKLADIEESQKSQEQKLADKLAEAERRAQEAELRAIKADVARAKGVPVELLAGGSEDELNASADALLAFRGEPQKSTATPSWVAGRNGAPVSGKESQLSRADLATMSPDQIESARKAGRLDSLLSGN